MRLMPKQPSKEEKEHPAYKRYQRKATVMFILLVSAFPIALLVDYGLGGYSGIATLVFLFLFGTLILGRSAERDRKEWQEWRKSRVQSVMGFRESEGESHA